MGANGVVPDPSGAMFEMLGMTTKNLCGESRRTDGTKGQLQEVDDAVGACSSSFSFFRCCCSASLRSLRFCSFSALTLASFSTDLSLPRCRFSFCISLRRTANSRSFASFVSWNSHGCRVVDVGAAVVASVVGAGSDTPSEEGEVEVEEVEAGDRSEAQHVLQTRLLHLPAAAFVQEGVVHGKVDGAGTASPAAGAGAGGDAGEGLLRFASAAGSVGTRGRQLTVSRPDATLR